MQNVDAMRHIINKVYCEERAAKKEMGHNMLGWVGRHQVKMDLI